MKLRAAENVKADSNSYELSRYVFHVRLRECFNGDRAVSWELVSKRKEGRVVPGRLYSGVYMQAVTPHFTVCKKHVGTLAVESGRQ